MTDLRTLGSEVEWPDHESATRTRELLTGRTGLGRLVELAEWVAGVRPEPTPQSTEPRALGFTRIRGSVLGGNSGVHAEASAAVGMQLHAVTDLPSDAAAALAAGVQRVDDEVDAGADLLVLAVPGLAADSAIAVSVLTNTEPVKVLSRGAAATDPEAWMVLAVEVRDARRRCKLLRDRPDELLAAIGSPGLAAAAGFALRAAVRRTPVLLDGPAAAVAALVAYEAAPRAVRWWTAADQGPAPAHELALTRLGQRAVLNLGTGLGDGLAAALAIPVLQAAARLAG